MAALAFVLAGLIIWWTWSTVAARHAPAMAPRFRGKRPDEAIEPPATPASAPWFAPPSPQLLDLKAARVRTEPTAAPEPVARIERRAGWTGEDDAELLRLLAENMTPEDIATRLRRSEKSVQLRIPLLRLRQRQAEQLASTPEVR